ncbi:MAG TPA: sigma-54 dependent transcriptional regulator [Pseudolabrys sp.]|nr:sigma-54 dependent transcriptional regulator [Pseudolabrys sp.]
MSQVVLIVDDDPVQRRLIENMAQRFGYEALTTDSGDQAIALLAGPTAQRVDCVVLDLVMPDLDGLGVLARMRDAGLDIPVIVQTAHGGIDNVVTAMRAGAVDFVVKPASVERLQVSIRNALSSRALAGELRRLKRSRDGVLTFADVITRAPAMQAVLRAAEKAASSDIPALIEGESGVGKELIARAIHGSGARRAKPFVAVNCGALPETLIESILFGHEKGAFTGATEKHTGKFVEADGGTLFLDEIGELPPAAQIKLLRALQEGEVDPVGARKTVKVDVRIISATNRDLIADVKAGRFREDLFYRLHVFPISVPPLRQRPEDIPELARHFLARFAAEDGRRVTAIEADALALLAAYRWPGNVRQLENAIFRAVVLAEGDTIGANELPQIAAQVNEADAAALIPSIAPIAARSWPNDSAGMTRPAPSASQAPVLTLTNERGDVRPLDDIERETIRFAIDHYRGQMSEVARRLRIGRSTLYRKLEGLGMDEKPAGNGQLVDAE